MQRRGTMSFVIEVKKSKRRFPLAGASTIIADQVGAGSAAPRSADQVANDATVEAAKQIANRLFSKGEATTSSQVPSWQELSAKVFAPDVGRARMAAPVEHAPPESPPRLESDPNSQGTHPRTGRILECLTSEDPIDALLRQEAEERAARRRLPRGPQRRRIIRADRTTDVDPSADEHERVKGSRRKKTKPANKRRRVGAAGRLTKRTLQRKRRPRKAATGSGAGRRSSTVRVRGKQVAARGRPVKKVKVSARGKAPKRAAAKVKTSVTRTARVKKAGSRRPIAKSKRRR